MLKPLVFVCVLLCLVLSVSGIGTYPAFGGPDGRYYSEETNKFNSGNDDWYIAGNPPVGTPVGMPLVADLDNNGEKEIVILTIPSIRIYGANATAQGVEVYGKASYLTSAQESDTYFSNMIIYDIDSDGFQEVIVYSVEEKYMYILQYNGTHFWDEGFNGSNTNWLVGNAEGSSDVLIGCGDSDGCLMVYSDYSTTAIAGNRYLWASQFDSTSQNVGKQVEITNVGSRGPCLPKFKSMPFDGSSYFFTFDVWSLGNIRLVKASINSSEHVTFSQVVGTRSSFDVSPDCGHNRIEFTSPTLNPDFMLESGSEIIYGFMVDDDEFNMVSYYNNLAIIKNYPKFQDATGLIIGNPFVSSAFIDTDSTSVCVIGYSSDHLIDEDGRLNILCVDETSSHSGPNENVEFIYPHSPAPQYNITATLVYSVASHSIESISEGPSGHISEILTPYGVFSLEDRSTACKLCFDNSCWVSQICDAEREWNLPLQNQIALISVDFLDKDKEDLIGLTDNSLYYISDGSINRNAYIGEGSFIQPNPDNTWKVHLKDYVVVEGGLKGEVSASDFQKVIGGPYGVGTYLSTHVKDVLNHSVPENNLSIELNYTFDFSCSGANYTKVSMFLDWFQYDPLAELTVRLYNFSSGLWVDQIEIYRSNNVLEWHNFTVDNFDDFVSDDITYLGFKDSYSSNPYNGQLNIDYLGIECYGESVNVPSNSTNRVKITVVPVDPDGDTVQARAFLYFGEDNEQCTGWSGNQSSGYPIPLESETGVILRPNQTTQGSILRIEVRDIVNFGYVAASGSAVWEESFDVAIQGDVWTDSTKTIGLTPDQFENGTTQGGEDFQCLNDADCGPGLFCGLDFTCQPVTEKNDVLDAIAPPELISSDFRPLYLVFLLVILMIGTGAWLQKSHVHDPRVWLMALGGVFLGGYSFLVYLNALPVWPLILLIVVSSAMIGVRFTPLYARIRGQ